MEGLRLDWCLLCVAVVVEAVAVTLAEFPDPGGQCWFLSPKQTCAASK